MATSLQIRYYVTAVLLAVLCAVAAVFLESHLLFFAPIAMVCLIAISHQPHLVFYLLLASVPWSIEYNVTPSLGTDLPDEPLMLLTGFSLVAFLLYSKSSLRFRSFFSPLGLLLILQFSWFCITVACSTLPLISFKFLLAKSWYLLAFVITPFVLFQEKKHLRNAAFILASSMMLCTIIGLVRHAELGFTFGKINDSLRPFFRNHVNYSALLVCMIPLLTLYYKRAVSKVKKWSRAILIIIAVGALFLSYARGAWLALIVGGAAYWLLQKRGFLKTYLLSFLLLFIGLFWMIRNDKYLEYAHDYNTTVFHTNFQEHLVATYQFKDVSTAERFYRWIAGVRMIKDRWETGFGPNTFYHHYRGYAVPAYKTWVSENEEHSTVHNYFLLTIIEQGVIGLLLLLVLLGYIFWRAQYLYHNMQDAFWKAAISTSTVILAMLCTVNFLSDLVETDKLGSVFYICIAVILVADVKTRQDLQLTPNV